MIKSILYHDDLLYYESIEVFLTYLLLLRDLFVLFVLICVLFLIRILMWVGCLVVRGLRMRSRRGLIFSLRCIFTGFCVVLLGTGS